MDIEISRVCNLECVHCPRKSNRLGKDWLSLETLQRSMDPVVYHESLKEVNFIGDGEPLLNPELASIITYFQRHHVFTMFTSNGTLITEDHVKFWEDSGVIRIHISIDSTKQEELDRLRKGAKLDRILESCYILGKSRIDLVINTVLFHETISDLPNIASLAKMVGAKKLALLSPLYIGHSDTKGDYTRPFIKPEDEAYLNLALAPQLEYTPIATIPTKRPCPFINWPFLSMEGNLYLCSFMGEEQEEERVEYYRGRSKCVPCGQSYLGNIEKTPLWELVYNNKTLEKIWDYLRVEKESREELSIGKFQDLRKKSKDICEDCLLRWGQACY